MKKLEKSWSEIKAESSWLIFKIMSEFVHGFDKLPEVGPCVSIFGSARTKPDHPYYQKAEKLAEMLCEEGYGVITGGGPGIMEAGNKGAHQVGGKSVGLNIVLPHEQRPNSYIDIDKTFDHNFFFVRKVMFVKYAQAFVIFPGGFGTMDELFEVLTLVQTRKIDKIPIILIGVDFWGGLNDWIRTRLIEEKCISRGDENILYTTDDLSEAITVIKKFYSKELLRPNF